MLLSMVDPAADGGWLANPLVQLAAALLAVALVYGWRARAHGDAERGGRTMALGIGLALALVVGELAVRLVIERRQAANSLAELRELVDSAVEHGAEDALVRIIRLRDDDLFQFELQPNLSRPYKGGTLRTNSVGMCEEREYPLAAEPDTYRICGIGDSGMFGWGVPHDRTYLWELEESLNASGEGRYEVLNFAIPAFNTRMEEEVLRQRVLAYRPDLVVVGWCENDTSLPNLLVQGLALRRDRTYLGQLLLDRADFDAMLTSGFGTSTDVAEQVVAPALRASVGEDAVVASMERMRDLGRTEGFALFVFGPMPEWLCEALDARDIPYGNTLELVDAAAYPEDWKVHAMHPSADGHGVLAGALERELRARGLLR